MGKLSPEFSSIRFVLVCDDCGAEIHDVHIERYNPEYAPSGNRQAGRRAA